MYQWLDDIRKMTKKVSNRCGWMNDVHCIETINCHVDRKAEMRRSTSPASGDTPQNKHIQKEKAS